MKGRRVVLDRVNGFAAAALLENGRLEDLVIDGERPRPGAVYRARAGRPAKGMGGMFVDIPGGTGFLRQAKGLSPGEAVLVQVTGFAESGKAVPVTSRIAFKSRHCIVTPGAPGVNVSRKIRAEETRDALLGIGREAMAGSDMGLVLRSSCAVAEAGEIAREIAETRARAEGVAADASGPCATLLEGDCAHALARREWSESAQFVEEAEAFAAHGVLDALEALRSPHAPLADGGSIFVESTRALVAVDVNTGADSSPAAGLKANLGAARELPRQLRLRGLGGQVVIDPAPMGKRDRGRFEAALKAEFRRDPVQSDLVGWTTLGHYEIKRRRERESLSEVWGPLADG